VAVHRVAIGQDALRFVMDAGKALGRLPAIFGDFGAEQCAFVVMVEAAEIAPFEAELDLAFGEDPRHAFEQGEAADTAEDRGEAGVVADHVVGEPIRHFARHRAVILRQGRDRPAGRFEPRGDDAHVVRHGAHAFEIVDQRAGLVAQRLGRLDHPPEALDPLVGRLAEAGVARQELLFERMGGEAVVIGKAHLGQPGEEPPGAVLGAEALIVFGLTQRGIFGLDPGAQRARRLDPGRNIAAAVAQRRDDGEDPVMQPVAGAVLDIGADRPAVLDRVPEQPEDRARHIRVADDAMRRAEHIGPIVMRDPVKDVIRGLDRAARIGARKEDLVEREGGLAAAGSEFVTFFNKAHRSPQLRIARRAAGTSVTANRFWRG